MNPTQTRAARRRLAVKLNADSRPLVYTVVALVTVLGVVSLLASFQGLVAVSSWARLPHELAWTVPAMLDGAIMIYTFAALIRRARGESARLAWTGVAAGTLLSAAANGAHVLLADVAADTDVLRGVGAGIAALSPVLAALAVHQLADLAVAGPDEDVAPARRTSRRVKAGPVRPVAPSLPGSVIDAPTSSAPMAESLRPVSVAPSAPPAPVPAGSRAAMRAAIVELAAAEPGLSNRAIAQRLGTSHSTVARTLEAATADPGARDASALIENDETQGVLVGIG